MKRGKFLGLLSALFVLSLAAAPAPAKDGKAKKPAAIEQLSKKPQKKDVALTSPDLPRGFPALDRIIEDVTTRLQEKIEDDFEEYLELQLKRVRSNDRSSVGGSLPVG